MKKFSGVVILVLLCSLLITGCSGSDKATTESSEPKSKETTSQPEETATEEQKVTESKEETVFDEEEEEVVSVMAEKEDEDLNEAKEEKSKDLDWGRISPAEAKEAIKSGIDYNKQDSEGKTPLIEAAYDGNEPVIEILLDNNADATVEDNSGNTALDYFKHYLEENKFSSKEIDVYPKLKKATE